MTKKELQIIGANILAYKASHQKDLTPVWNCAQYHNAENEYLKYREVAYMLANKNQPSYQKLCEPFEMGEDKNGYLTENNINVIKKSDLEKFAAKEDNIVDTIYDFLLNYNSDNYNEMLKNFKETFC